MYVIVIGGGEVGHYLCKQLLEEGHEVVVIEKDARICEYIEEELGDICLHGDASEITILKKAGITRADMVIAVTGEDEDNLAACQVAKQKFKVPRVIARINTPRNEKIFAKLGVERTVDAVELISEHIKAETMLFPVTRLFSIRDRGLEVVLVRVGRNSPAVGKPIGELSLPLGSVISLVIPQGKESEIPAADVVLKEGSQLICLVPTENIGSLQAIFKES
jgi:trk system potassium uptake protein TrkA